MPRLIEHKQLIQTLRLKPELGSVHGSAFPHLKHLICRFLCFLLTWIRLNFSTQPQVSSSCAGQLLPFLAWTSCLFASLCSSHSICPAVRVAVAYLECLWSASSSSPPCLPHPPTHRCPHLEHIRHSSLS